jgi:ATP-dependent 26S proteasome regulatory subunit
MSRTGRWVTIRGSKEIELVDLLGAMPNRGLPPTSGSAIFVGRELWVLEQAVLHRVAPEDLRPLPPRVELPGQPSGLLAGYGASAADAIALGAHPSRLSVRGDAFIAEPLEAVGAEERVLAAFGTRMILGAPGSIRAVESTRGEVWRASGLLDEEVRAATFLLGGRALAVLGRSQGTELFLVLRSTGALVHQIAIERPRVWAIAEELGHAFVVDDEGLCRIDLRYGKVRSRVAAPIAALDLAVDQDGRHLVLAGAGDEVVHCVVSELFRAEASASAPTRAAEAGEEGASQSAPEGRDTPLSPVGHRVAPPPPPDAAGGDEPPEPAPPPRPVAVPAMLPLAFGAPPPPRPTSDGDEESPYPSARAHLDALLDLVAARTAVTIADAWNSGRLSGKDATRRPHELEVSALLGGAGNYAPEKLAETKARVDAKQREASARARASAARGIRLPFPELARELGLSGVAAQVLLIAAAPALRGEIARLYGVLTNDPARPIVDRFLAEMIVAGDKSTLRDQIARELASDAPLVRHGVVHVGGGPGMSLFAPLSVPDALLDRLRGLPPARADDLQLIRGAECGLEDLYVPGDVKRDLVLALAEPRPSHDPVRLVLRGRRGSGRHSLVAALAATVGREIVAIDTARMPRAPRELVGLLRGALVRASMHALIPVISGLEQIEPTDADLREQVRQVLRGHPGPVVVRTSPESMLPLDPGFVQVRLPSLSETERADAWRGALRETGLTADVDALASRYRIGPGIVKHVVGQAAARSNLVGEDSTAVLDAQVRQHVATRLDHVASRVSRLSDWEDVALPEEMLDSLREFIGRARHRRTVFERWGYDAKMTTSRGLTSLFYGPPGTGKTMVAGLIARELGLDMYRVDLARVVSKWVGETEKNLAEVFDAAEDGQVLILFDEADSLFAKRTDVRSSNDRYANLEVNYLLQRLDSFEGVAILTSNLDGAIDPAFRRRMSLRLQFPFPDEEMRVRLWAAHVTPQTPTVGDFDFVDLARRFPLSGGYIRNCAVRAAFLAAHENQPLGQEHLIRAIQLEYRELGKLSTSSRME